MSICACGKPGTREQDGMPYCCNHYPPHRAKHRAAMALWRAKVETRRERKRMMRLPDQWPSREAKP